MERLESALVHATMALVLAWIGAVALATPSRSETRDAIKAMIQPHQPSRTVAATK